MTILGRDPQRAELPGVPTSISVSVLWIQQGFNAWRVATSSRMAPITEDGAWGPNTLGAVTAMVSVIDPASLSTIIPATDRRSVVISRKIEGYISSLNRVSAARTTTTPVVNFTPSTDLTATPGSGEALVVSGSGVEPWVYALVAATFLVTAGVTYVALDTK
jgi:hypothetical protein